MATRTFLETFLDAAGIIAQRPTPWVLVPDRAPASLRYNPPRDPMSLISASDLAKSYGAEDIFSHVSLAVPHQARIALVVRALCVIRS